ncbi:DUF7683 domain-containing protein [Streptomyces roseolilacinus]|uniref:DUF7683 domain-containing protein n=1 Tax=Streptomyces roseolilacinus TaxID=66904 RepID=UPI00380FFF44
MKYVVVSYDKVSEAVEEETDVSAVGAERLAELIGVPVERLVDAYPLEERHRAALTAWAGLTFAADAYDYFLEVEAD